ncbi:MAG: amidohydrolase family protein [Flavobacteriales bacterium]|jgi:imidazolonepropionase-like amidohydrolase|nr:amidohydrolase family protein [Flavobacteriales bacterium]MDC0909420.1 amidohydrolase family protein [Flavobacteriales bacterium]
MNKFILTLIVILITINTMAQKPILFIGGIAHIGNGEVIENSAISIKEGSFDIVADANLIRIDPTAFDTIIKLYGKHIYPSFIVPNTTLGITEIDAVRASRDFNEIGGVNPNIRSLIAYNSDSKITKTIRTNGVLIAQVTPRGGLVSGQSSIMFLEGNNWEDAALKVDDGIHINWPNSYYTTGWWAEPGETKENKKYSKKIYELNRLFSKAKSYYSSSEIIDLKMESMRGLFNGSKNLYIHANSANEIRDAIEFFENFKVNNLVIVGGEDALKVSNILVEKNIPVILNRVHRLPKSQDSPVDEPYIQAKKLQDKGILFCLSYEGDMEAMGARNIAFTAGTTIAYGLKYEKAVQSITLNTAKILGIDHLVGSIQSNKNATFFISSGDALDMRSNNVEKAYINGKEINLNNHQKELFNKYK